MKTGNLSTNYITCALLQYINFNNTRETRDNQVILFIHSVTAASKLSLSGGI